MGEFSFLLSVIGLDAGVISDADSRLVVAVTVLSLSLSPLWVVTGRRLRALAGRGITSGSELLRLVYRPETEFVAGTLGKVTAGTLHRSHSVALWLRQLRQRQKEGVSQNGNGAHKDEAANPAPDTTPKVEIISPNSPANDPGPEPTPPETKAEKK
ncbi:MAG: hypothetical protein HQ513_00215 [Rhodospirillales bacterium]|nr:hypothetical protein [Rhodospirillales bacterium]